jgi:hypothetical protein
MAGTRKGGAGKLVELERLAVRSSRLLELVSGAREETLNGAGLAW